MLNLASIRNSPDRSTKSTRSHLNVLPQLVNTGFQVLFHSPPGVLFTFPSQYYALSVTKEYLALGGGPPDFPQGFSCLAVLWILLLPIVFMYGAFTLSGWLSQNHSTRLTRQSCSPNPGVHALRFGLFRVRSPLLTESHVVFSSSGYLDVSVHRVPFHSLWIGLWILEVFSSRFPHSEISGSMDICSSPKLFAAYHVFHRLLVPRHPPCALISLTN